MRPGDKWRLYLKSELGYAGGSKHVEGHQHKGGTPRIRPGEVLIFDLELVRFTEHHWWYMEGLHWWHVASILVVLFQALKTLFIRLDRADVGETHQALRQV